MMGVKSLDGRKAIAAPDEAEQLGRTEPALSVQVTANLTLTCAADAYNSVGHDGTQPSSAICTFVLGVRQAH